MLESLKHTKRFRPNTALSHTTTSRDRNIQLLHGAFQNYSDLADKPSAFPSILEIGPGVCTRYLPVSIRPFRLLDKLCRKLPLPTGCYESYETSQIINIGKSYGFSATVTTLDVSTKTLRVVSNTNQFKKVRLLHEDLCEPVCFSKDQFDMVICLNVLMHMRHREPDEALTAMHNLVNYCKPGGVLLANGFVHTEYSDIFARINETTYLKSTL